jgi:putative alpha-1,2-mannosidase
MVQLSPDTRLEGWDGCGGYHITDSVAYGFSHTHLQGTGVSDYGDVLLMPCTRFAPENAWRDRIKSSLANETAHAGYYACDLVDHGIRAELTTTPRVGIHRYTLREPDTVSVVVDLAHRDELMHYSMEPLDAYTVVGHRVSDNWAKEQHVYFAMRLSRPLPLAKCAYDADTGIVMMLQGHYDNMRQVRCITKRHEPRAGGEIVATVRPCIFKTVQVSHNGGVTWSTASANVRFLFCDIYVSTTGSDVAGHGTPDRPYATLQRAIEAALGNVH